MKKFFATILGVMLVSVVLNSSSSYADSYSSVPIPPFSSIANTESLLSDLTIEEYNELMENAIPIESLRVNPEETQSTPQISLRASAASWSYSNFGTDTGARFSSQFTIPSQQIVTLTVVQWAYHSTLAQPNVGYSLINKDYRGELTIIRGRYTGTNESTQIRVPAGTYEVMINNLNDYKISGNGYLTK